jgi:hypothetical protein
VQREMQAESTPALAFRWQIGRNRGIERVRKQAKTRTCRSFKWRDPDLNRGPHDFQA